MSPPPEPESAGSVEQLLDSGASGLQYFEHYLPLLDSLGHSSEWTYSELCARYDEQRGLDVSALTADAEWLGGILDDARSRIEESTRLADELEQSWTGDSARAAIADARQDSIRASGRLDSIDAVNAAMRTATDVVVDCVRDKTEFCGRIDVTGVGGVPESAVNTIVKFAVVPIGDGPSIGIVANLDVPVLARWLPAVSAYVGERGQLDDASLRRVQQLCAEWLGSVFVPDVSETCSAFVEVCARTDTAVRDALAVVAKAAEAVDTSPFPTPATEAVTPNSPDVRPAHADSSNESECTVDSAVSHQDSTVAAGSTSPPRHGAPDTSPGRPVADAPVPSTTGPSDAPVPAPPEPSSPAPSPLDSSPPAPSAPAPSPPVPTAAEFVALVEDAVARVGDELSARIRDALDELRAEMDASPESEPTEPSAPPVSNDPPDQAEDNAAEPNTENDSDPSEQPPGPRAPLPNPPLPPPGDGTERGHLEAELDGHRARIAVAHDGTLSLQLDTPDGGRRFELRAGPFGLPVVVETQQVDQAAAPPQAPARVEPAQADPQPAAPVSPSEPPEAVVSETDSPDQQVDDCVPDAPSEPIVAEQPPHEQPPHDQTVAQPLPPSGSGARLVEAGPL